MPASRGQTSICILRIETESDRLLITLTMERYLHRGLAAAGDPRVLHFAQPEQALAAVAEFVRSHHPHGVSPG